MASGSSAKSERIPRSLGTPRNLDSYSISAVTAWAVLVSCGPRYYRPACLAMVTVGCAGRPAGERPVASRTGESFFI